MSDEIGPEGPDAVQGPDAIQIPYGDAALDAMGGLLAERGRLIASGGWCAPSETVFPFGSQSIPEVEMPRAKQGGFKFGDLPSAESMAQRNMERLISETINDALRKQLDAEEAFAAAAITAGCGYAIIGEQGRRFVTVDDFDDNSYSIMQVWSYRLLPDWPRVERLEFPSLDAYEDWAELPLEQRLKEIDDFKAVEDEL